MRVLWVATKPPVPPIDGGCVVMARTIAALDAIGVRGTVVAPAARRGRSALGEWTLVRVATHPAWAAVMGSFRMRSLSLGRHVSPPVRRTVARLLDQEPFDVVHAEQIQALPQCAPARARGIPLVLRAQNVEGDVLHARSGGHALLARELGRLRAFEAAAPRAATATVALTRADADRLAALSGIPVRHVPAPFPSELEAGPSLPGAPAVVVFGSRHWFPNRDGAAWFLDAVWPAVRARLPDARLHLVGLGDGRTPGVTVHPAPADSATAFARGAVLAVPSRVATGVRIKVLEAWSRGMPVVATPEAAAGLDGDGIVVAAGALGFADALARVHADSALAAGLVRAGRATLRRHHDPGDVARRLQAIYAEVSARSPRPRPPAEAAPPGDLAATRAPSA